MFAVISADFETMKNNYYKHNKLNKPMQTLLDGLNEGIRKENEKRAAEGKKALGKATSCCFQVSHSLNAANIKVPEKSSQRTLFNPPGGNGYYLGNVFELEEFLEKFGKTTEISNGGKLPIHEIKKAIFGRQGILVFRDSGLGYHTELWDKHDILQRQGISGGMSEAGIFAQKRILFWEVTKTPRSPTIPEWMVGWWSVNDGSQYYYHILGLDYAYWTSNKPGNRDQLKPYGERENYGDVTMTATGFNITWDYIGGGQTKETYTRAVDGSEFRGTSSRYDPLLAKKMF